jgi:hypothetical protein
MCILVYTLQRKRGLRTRRLANVLPLVLCYSCFHAMFNEPLLSNGHINRNIISIIKWRTVRWVVHAERFGEMNNENKISVGEPDKKKNTAFWDVTSYKRVDVNRRWERGCNVSIFRVEEARKIRPARNEQLTLFASCLVITWLMFWPWRWRCYIYYSHQGLFSKRREPDNLLTNRHYTIYDYVIGRPAIFRKEK